MARDSKLAVGAINIRIPETHERNYTALLALLADLRRGVRVYGDSYLAISFFDPEKRMGVFSKYTEIDIDGDWFDLDDFDTATPEKVEEINIPEKLKPNLAQFHFELSPDLHVIVFSTYSSSKNMSTRSVEKYFAEALNWPEITERYGCVESDVVKSYDRVEEILALPELKELRLIIRRPNSDDIGGGLARVIEERLRSVGGDEYEEVLRARGSHNLTPDERAKDLSIVAGENGQVRGKSIVNGVLTETNTEDSPLTEVTTYKPDQPELPLFTVLAQKLFNRIAAARARLSGAPNG